MKKLITIILLAISFPTFASSDIGIIRIQKPCGIVMLGTPATVQVWVKNFGSTSIDSIPIVLSINNSILYHDTLVPATALLAGDSILMTSNHTFTMPLGYFMLCAKTQLAGDIDSTNDKACNYLYGMNGGQPMDLCLVKMRPTINNPKAGSHEVFDIYVHNSGFKAVDTVNVSVIYSNVFHLYASFPLPQSLLPDSSVWVNVNFVFNRHIGANLARIAIHDPADQNSMNDTAKYIFYGSRQSFDISVDSFEINPSKNDSILNNLINLKVYYTNQGTQPLNRPFHFLFFQDNLTNVIDTITKNIVLQSNQTDSFSVNEIINYNSQASTFFVGTIDVDSNQFNDEAYHLYYFSPVSISDSENPITVLPFPNPSNGKFYFKIDQSNNASYNFQVIDSQGKIVYQNTLGQLTNNQILSIDLSQLSDGIYFYSFEINGRKSGGKLVVKH